MGFNCLALHNPQIRFADVFRTFSAKDPKELLESSLGAYLHTCVKLTGSGRYGLKTILDLLELTPGDEVIIPSFICPSVADAVIESGATPVFADVGRDDINISPESTEKAITGKTKAIVIAHIFGIPAKIDQFLRLSNKYSLPLIEDCGQSFGARYDGQFTGTCGDFGFFSFGVSKNISAVGGGAICWNEKHAELVRSALEENARRVKMQCRPNPVRQYILAVTASFAFNKYAYVISRRFISRYSDSKRLKSQFRSYERGMTRLEARLAFRQLARYSRTVDVRRNNAEIYREYLGKHFKLPDIPAKATPACLHFPLLTDRATELKRGLAMRSIEVKDRDGMHFDALYKHPEFAGYRRMGSNAEKTEKEYLLFPTGYSEDETREICRIALEASRWLEEC